MDDRVPEKRAKQGRRGMPILVVLIVALILAAVGWWLVEIYGTVIDEQQPVETPQSEDTPAESAPADDAS